MGDESKKAHIKYFEESLNFSSLKRTPLFRAGNATSDAWGSPKWSEVRLLAGLNQTQFPGPHRYSNTADYSSYCARIRCCRTFKSTSRSPFSPIHHSSIPATGINLIRIVEQWGVPQQKNLQQGKLEFSNITVVALKEILQNLPYNIKAIVDVTYSEKED